MTMLTRKRISEHPQASKKTNTIGFEILSRVAPDGRAHLETQDVLIQVVPPLCRLSLAEQLVKDALPRTRNRQIEPHHYAGMTFQACKWFVPIFLFIRSSQGCGLLFIYSPVHVCLLGRFVLRASIKF